MAMVKKPTSRSASRRSAPELLPFPCEGCEEPYEPHFSETAECFICCQPLHTFYCMKCCILNMYKHIACPRCQPLAVRLEEAEEIEQERGYQLPWIYAFKHFLQGYINGCKEWQGSKPMKDRRVYDTR